MELQQLNIFAESVQNKAFVSNHRSPSEDYDKESELLRIIAMGKKSSSRIQKIINRHPNEIIDYQALAYSLTGLTVSPSLATRTLKKLIEHQGRMEQALGRPMGIKSAALDSLENIDFVFNEEGKVPPPTYDQLAQMAFYDPLTGLPNYRYFSTRLNEEIKRAVRYNHQLSLAMLDIDRFKQFNDQYGHPTGNRALQQLSHLLKSMIRDTDIVSRYGGEEFAFIFPETTKRSARVLCERIRKTVQNKPIKLGKWKKAHITVSFGISTYPRDARLDKELLDGADQALYHSKHSGRNCLSLFAPETFAEFIYTPKDPQVVKKVCVVGSFNHWDPKADPLKKQEDGTFKIKIHMIPDTYQYKFLINGEYWTQDTRSKQSVSDGFEGSNSIIELKR